MADPTSAVSEAIEAELRFLDPAVHSSASLLGRLLHPDFQAFGSSGRIWDRESLVAELRERGPSRPITASMMQGVQVGPGLVHLTFDTDSNGRLSHRSSLWMHTGEGWLLYFHQGTIFSYEERDGRGAAG
jgi:hypothetical protein